MAVSVVLLAACVVGAESSPRPPYCQDRVVIDPWERDYEQPRRLIAPSEWRMRAALVHSSHLGRLPLLRAGRFTASRGPSRSTTCVDVEDSPITT